MLSAPFQARALSTSFLLVAFSIAGPLACESAVEDGNQGVGGDAPTTGSASPDGSSVADAVGSTGSSFGPGASTGGVVYDDDMPTYFPARCPQSSTWSIACLTVKDHAVLGLNPETGETCTLGENLAIGQGTLNGLALVGDRVIGCFEGAETLLVVDVVQETSEMIPLPAGCSSITDSNDVLYYQMVAMEVTRADSVDAMVNGPFDEIGLAPYASRLGARNGKLYSAWHSTSEIETWDIATATQLPTIALQGFDGWVWGIAPLDDGRVVILSTGRVLGFASDGTRLFDTPIDAAAGADGGLRCFSPEPMPVPS